MERNILTKGVIYDDEVIPFWDSRLKWNDHYAGLTFESERRVVTKFIPILFNIETKETSIPNIVDVKNTKYDLDQTVLVETTHKTLREEVIDKIKWSYKNCDYYIHHGHELSEKDQKRIKNFSSEKIYTFRHPKPVFYFKSGGICMWEYKLYKKATN